MTPTDEQLDIISAGTTTKSNLMINALAGTGKSATIKLLDRAHRKTETRLYLVFNKRNSDEAIAAQKADEFSGLTKISTFNSCGLGIWSKVIANRPDTDGGKMRKLWRIMLDEMAPADAQEAWPQYTVVMDGIEKAKALGYVPADVKIPHTTLIDRNTLHLAMDEVPNEFAAELIDSLLTRSIALAYGGQIDFNDQIYMPALFEGVFPRFARVYVDEYQDQSPVNHRLVERIVAAGNSRIIGVGDPNQNIYGFRGALAGGMASAVQRYSMIEFPLSISFRCPQAIVEAARWRVPHFQWSKIGGHVETVNHFAGPSFPDDAVVICRNNAPLLRLAFKLISAGRSVTVVGSDLGPRIVGIMKKLGDAMMSRDRVYVEIEMWRDAKLTAGSKSANDLADCMRVFAEHGDRLTTMISYAEHIFKQTGTIRLLTGHKSKGLEFDNVFFLDPDLLDGREQDLNLRYVIQTRSQNSLTMLDSESISW